MKTPVVAAACATVALLALPAGAAPPQQQISQLKGQVEALKTQVKQLRRQKADLTKESARAWRRELALRRYAAAEGKCKVTRANGSQPPDGNIGGPGVHGNGSLWVSIGEYGSVVVNDAEPSGAVRTKFPWWRGVTGPLRIEGRRLDGGAPPLSAELPDGYGPTGFQASSVTFPTEGCWEVTGRAGGASLTFVTLVLKAG